MAILFALGLLLFGIWVVASMIITLLVMVSPIAIGLLIGYGIWRLVLAFRAIERERAAHRDQRDGEQNV